MTNDELVNALTQTLVSRVENCNVRVFDELGSTNSLLMSEPVGPVADAQAVLALHQTAGRGRRGRQWRSAPQAGLYASVAYTYDRMPDQIAALTLALGVCVARTLESLGLGDAMLKWPNDLVWQDRKLGGILVETTTASDGRFRVVAGVGINRVLPAGFALDAAAGTWSKGIVDLATANVKVSLTTLAKAVVPAVLDVIRTFDAAQLPAITEAFNRRHWLQGRAAELNDQMVRCDQVDEAGRLIVVNMNTGGSVAIDTGEVNPLAWSEAS